MERFSMVALKAAAFALAAGGLAAGAHANADTRPTPKNWKYEIKDGKRVPKGDRETRPDGSWREEIRQGKCLTIKEKTAAGEYRESRRCD